MKLQNNDDFLKELFQKNLLKTAINEQNDIKTISSGSISLNKSLGIGGYPIGKIIEIYGNESSGKTTLALHAIYEAQKQNMNCLFVDVENSLDVNYAKKIGIDLNNLLVAHPNSGEEAFDIMELLIKNKKVDLIVVDSVAAMIPLIEAQTNMDEQQIGLHARMMSKGMRKIQSALIDNECTIIFINQIREKVGVFFGNPETTTGGKALKFYSSIRIETKKVELIKDANEKIGIQIKATVVKNKLAPPLKSAFIDIYFEKGFNYDVEIIDFAIKNNIINKNGSWYSYNGEKLCQGREQLINFLNNKKEIFQEIKKQTLENI